ncbi:ABC transporter substrate-binding protein [Proteus myxofaciens]|uniref:Periplasmic substrate-binding component of an ABC superfamily oligopeptide transporter n=1 Tax=Proteus myxofaciens ATCC 19692 TaxID=1354337 RepID=A0A198GKT8_9GAMM|nr:ABC transporter substrate-binding protein [Proteus myxofaciens]OAT37515.1 periplasmic substrate-binding component of an ABC superfamily oligopeptide transporter [Proteus myxofaciens ATCC 19692]
MKNKVISTKILTASIISLAFTSFFSNAVTPPDGTILAKQQNIVINNGTEVSSLDPHKVEGVPESNIILNVLEGLVYIGADGENKPGVAERWDTDDNKIWTFYLRKDAKWSDGSPVTANDFVYSWRRLVDPQTGSPYASYLEYAYVENVADILTGKKKPDTLGVKAIDAHTFQVKLTQPVPYLINMLNHTSLKPVKKEVIEQYGINWTRPEHFIGNGAYTLDKWVVNEKLTLKRNPLYWDNKNTIIDQATFLPINSETSDINRYRSGEIQITNSAIPPILYKKMKQEQPENLHVTPYLCTFFYELNNKRAPFDDARVREAVKLSLDRNIIAEKIMGQGQIPAYSFTPSFINNGHFKAPEWASWTQEQRNEKARQLLKEAGFDNNNPLAFTLLYNTSDQNKQQAIAAASMWKKNIGADVTLQNQEWKTALESRNQGNYQVARATWCADYNEPTSFLNSYLSTSSLNTIFYNNSAYDEALNNALMAVDEGARHQLYQRAEALLDKDSGIVPVYYRVSVRLVSPKVGGFTGKDPFDYTDLKRYFIKADN